MSINSRVVSRRMASRDAYMLVYMRREATPGERLKVQNPPQRALDVVLRKNQDHANACSDYNTR